MSPGPRGPERAIVLTLFVCFAYFFQGGGWNQNSRFDQVRAIVEGGTLSIDDFLVYAAAPGSDGRARLRRFPFASAPPAGAASHRGGPVTNTGDLSTYEGRVFPNKPPGTTFLAVPAYWAIEMVEWLLGIDRDGWWTMTLNLYLTTVLSVGLLGAFGGALFHRLSRRLFPEVAPARHAAAALAFGLTTLVFPFSTVLFDHVPVAVFSMLGFHLLLGESQEAARRAAGTRHPTTADARLAAAGLACGLAVLNNYAAVLTVALLSAYALAVCRPRARVLFFVAGGAPAALVLALYHRACFGHAFTLATSYESALFTQGPERWLGVFGAPDPTVLIRLLISPYRGLFFSSPILMLGAYGLWRMRSAARREALLCAAVVAAFLLMNASFNGWHGGYSFGPRYLIPAVPFLALPLAPVFERLPRSATILALVSGAMILLATAVDPQVPFDQPRPWSGYLLPLVSGGAVARPPHRIEGPVSANPQGVAEKFAHDLFPERSAESDWSSFNLGELLWPGSLMSLLPLLVVLGAGGRLVLLRARDVPAP